MTYRTERFPAGPTSGKVPSNGVDAPDPIAASLSPFREVPVGKRKLRVVVTVAVLILVVGSLIVLSDKAADEDQSVAVAANSEEAIVPPSAPEAIFPPSAPLADGVVPDMSETVVFEDAAATLVLQSANSDVSLRFERSDTVGGGEVGGESSSLPAIVYADITDPTSKPAWRYLFGMARAEVAEIELLYHDGSRDITRTVETRTASGLRLFVVKVPLFDRADYPSVIALDNEGRMLTSSDLIISAEPPQSD